jgi:hypothetical protein
MRGERGYDVSVALLGSGIMSRVRRGENAGRDLHHEFVALGLETASLVPGDAGELAGNVTLARRTDIAVAKHALAVWVTAHADLMPLQAAGGWLPAP